MTKFYFLFINLSLFTACIFCQNTIDYSNTRDGEDIEYCVSHKRLQKVLNQSEALRLQFEQAQREIRAFENAPQTKSGRIYKIPVVFHILHNGGSENISKDQILDALRIVNRDYRKQNADTADVVSSFKSRIADVRIEFAMATKAPDGTCFDGITRTKHSYTSRAGGITEAQQIRAVFNGNDVYNGTWNATKYLNIFVCKDIGGAAGYTYRPMNNSAVGYNSIFIVDRYIGSVGSASVNRSRSLTHEIGHWLDLPHTWGNTNNPGTSSNCSTDDGIRDTPNTTGVRSCQLRNRTCGVLANVENYMDYSYCSKMFTEGQKTRMRAALNFRYRKHWETSNLDAVGVTTPGLCKGEFSESTRVICKGEKIAFTDESFNRPTSWNWEFEAGNPVSSTSQNPTVTYNWPGKFKVKLTVSNGSQTKIANKVQHIVVLPQYGRLNNLREGFEQSNVLDNWFDLSKEDAKWSIKNVGATGGKSMGVNAYENRRKSTVSVLESGNYNIMAHRSVNLSFKYAYANVTSRSTAKLEVFVSKDCGKTWRRKRTIIGSALSTVSNTSSAFVPSSSSHWKTGTVSAGGLASYRTANFRMKFVFTQTGGNNFYIDDIQIVSTSVGIDENRKNPLSIYPNPVQDKLTITWNKPQQNMVFLYNSTGVRVRTIDVSNKEKQDIDLSNLPKGVYFLQYKSNKDRTFIKKVVKI